MHELAAGQQTPQLDIFYGILILFMIRCTLRSVLRYSECDAKATGYQVNQDHSFDRGIWCPLYEPLILALGSRKETFGELIDSRSELTAVMGDNDSDQQKDGYRAALTEAASLLDVPTPRDKTPMDHIQHFFKLMFPAHGPGAGGMGL